MLGEAVEAPRPLPPVLQDEHWEALWTEGAPCACARLHREPASRHAHRHGQALRAEGVQGFASSVCAHAGSTRALLGALLPTRPACRGCVTGARTFSGRSEHRLRIAGPVQTKRSPACSSGSRSGIHAPAASTSARAWCTSPPAVRTSTPAVAHVRGPARARAGAGAACAMHDQWEGEVVEKVGNGGVPASQPCLGPPPVTQSNSVV